MGNVLEVWNNLKAFVKRLGRFFLLLLRGNGLLIFPAGFVLLVALTDSFNSPISFIAAAGHATVALILGFLLLLIVAIAILAVVAIAINLCQWLHEAWRRSEREL